MNITLLQTRIKQAYQHVGHPFHYLGKTTIFGIQLIDEYVCLCAMTIFFAFIIYFSFTCLSYVMIYKLGRSKFAPNQKQLQQYEEQKYFDIKWSIINMLLNPPFVCLIRMLYPYYSKVQYDWNINMWFPIYLILHIAYDQFFTYWIHRLLHHPSLYGKLHYIHHKSKAITPFSGFAFHPIDSFVQAVPIFTSCFFLPLPLDVVLAHGALSSLWAISIHDNVDLFPFKGILYAGSHSIHHFPWGENYNYGKITSICDRLYGSYCDPQNLTGYGYESPAQFQKIIKQLNQVYQLIVPDKGKQKVEKQSRRLAIEKRQKIISQKHKNH